MKLQEGDNSSLSWGETFIVWYIWEGINLSTSLPIAMKKTPEINRPLFKKSIALVSGVFFSN